MFKTSYELVMFIQNNTCRIKIGLSKPVSAAPQPVLACPILIVFILFPLKCNEYCIVFREISLTPFSILIPHTSAYSDRLNANQLRHYETCSNCNICLKVATLTWQFHFFRPATNEWTSAILRVLIQMYLDNQSITQISGKSKTIWIWMDINPQWILLYLAYWMSCPTHQCQDQYRVQIGHI